MGIVREISPELDPVEFPENMDEAAVDAFMAQRGRELRQGLIARRQAQLAAETEGDEALRYAEGGVPFSERVGSTILAAPQSAMRQTGQTLRGLGEFLATAPIPRERGEIAPEIVRENIRRAQRTPAQVERDVEASPTRRLGGEMVAAAPEAFQTLPGVRESLPSQVSGGIGSVGALLPAGLTGPAAPFVGGAMYGLSAGEDFADDAEQVINSRIAEALAQGDTSLAADLERRKFDMKNTARMAGRVIGAGTQAILGSNIRIGKSNIGGIGSGIAERLVPAAAPVAVQNAVRGAVEGYATEFAQEGAERWLGNMAAKAVYDPTRKASEGVLHEAVVGGFTGGIVGGAFGSRPRNRNILPASRAAVAEEVVPGTEIPQDIGAPDLTLEDLGGLLPAEATPEAAVPPVTTVSEAQEPAVAEISIPDAELETEAATTAAQPSVATSAATPSPASAQQTPADPFVSAARYEGVELIPVDYQDNPVYDPGTKTITRTSGKSSVVSMADRQIVVVNVNGIPVPFYRSTGKAGKKNVAKDKWYPIFGIASDGWINKGTEAQISSYYGSPELKAIAEALDRSLGVAAKGTLVSAKAIRGSVNQMLTGLGLSPVENGTNTSISDLAKNIKIVLAAINSNARQPTTSVAPELSTPVPATQETPENMGISQGTPVPEAAPTPSIPPDDTAMEAATAAAVAPRTPTPLTTAPDEGIAERAAVDEEMTRATTRVPEVATAQVGMPDEGVVGSTAPQIKKEAKKQMVSTPVSGATKTGKSKISENESSKGKHFVRVVQNDGTVDLHVFDSEDQAGFFHGQVRSLGGVSKIGRAKGNSKTPLSKFVEQSKSIGSVNVIRHDKPNPPVTSEATPDHTITEAPAAEPPAAQAAEVATPEAVKQSKPPMAPKAQKAFLLEEIDKALEEAPDPESRWEELADKWNASPEKAAAGPDTKAQAAAQKAFMDAQPPAPVFDPFIIIEVPGNGTFKINNTKRALKAFKERAKKFPTDTAGPTRTPLPAKGQSKPAAIGKNTKETFLATAKDFVSDDPDRKVLQYVMSDGKRSAATDGRSMLVWDEPFGGKKGEQKLFGLDGKEVKADQSLNIPNWNSVIPKSPEVVFKKLNTERLFGIVKQAIAGPKEIDVGKRRTEEVLRNVHILSNPDGSIGVFSESQFGDYVHNVQKGAKNISKVDGERLLDIVQAARRLGSESVSMAIDAQDPKTPLVFKWDGAQAILMPLGNIEPSSTLQSLTTGEKQPDILERALNAAIKATDPGSSSFSDAFLIGAVGMSTLNAALRIVRRVYLKTRDLARAKRQGMRLIRRQLRTDPKADLPRIEEAFNQLVEGTAEKPGPDQIEAFQAADGSRRQKSRGLFTGDVTVDTDAEWQAGAERWINQFNGNIRRAFEAARSTDYATTGLNPAAQDYVFGRLLELTEIQANAARNDVDAMRALNLQKEITDATRLASSEAGKALGARALVQNRILWMFPVLSYRNLIREAQKRLPFPDVVADEVRTWLQESGRRAVQEMRNAMTDADKVFARELKTTVRDMRVVWRDVMTASVESQEAMRRKILEELVKAPELKGLSRQGYIDIANLLGKAWEKERARIFAAEFRKQVPLPTVKEDVRRKLFTAIPDILKWANLGLLDNEAFRNAVAPKFGVAKFDGETAKKLNEMAQRAQKVDGSNRKRIIDEMYNLMQVEGGVRWPDIVRDYWYAAVLGAVNTQVDNALGVINGALNTVMGMAMSPPEVRKAMGKSYVKGFSEGIADFFPILWNGEVWRSVNFNPEQPANTLNALSKSGNLFARGLSVGKYVSRLMTALDQVNALSMDQAAKAYAIGRRYPIEHLRRYMMPSENVLRTARLKAEAEGTPPNLMRKRVREIVQESIPVEVLISSKDIRELVTFTNQPKGLMGALYRGVQEMEKKAPGFKVLSGTNFLRFAANYSNEILNYVAPVALYRYYVSAPSRADGRLGLKMGQEERQLILAKLAVGTALGTFAAALFLGDDDDEKDRKIDITGSFKSLDPNKRKQLLSEGRAPYSIRIGDKYVSYRQLPFGGVLGAIGELRDRQLYNPKEWNQESIARKFVDGAFAGSLIVRDSPAISSFTEFLGTANAYKYDMNEQVEKSLPKYIARLGGSFIPRIAKEIDAWADPTIYKANTGHEFFLQQMPIFRRELGEGPVLNVLGEPVQVERYPWSRWVKTRKEDKAWSTLGELASKGVFLPVPSVTVKVLENGKRREMTPAESYRYQQRVGQAYRKFVEDNAERLLRMKPDEATDFIDTQTERIRSRIRAGGA